MTTTADDLSHLVPNAKALMQKIASAEAEKASQEMRRQSAEEAEKKALIDRLSKPSGLSDEEVMKKASVIIERAAKNGLTEVQVYRFPNTLCTDRGRAIQPARTRLGKNPYRNPEGDFRVLAAAPPLARLQTARSDH